MRIERRPEVHPRGCGENATRSPCRMWMSGPSPRVRGKRRQIRHHHLRLRSIPAGAGKTPLAHPYTSRRGVHPRGCGENDFMGDGEAAAVGPSPRVRGKLVGGLHARLPKRSIPAGAGKTPYIDNACIASAVHPRGCGENSYPRCLAARCGGPSPRVRGKLCRHLREQLLERSIPAGAGKTLARLRVNLLKGVHPRGCGENGLAERREMGRRGPSPRVRGKPMWRP